MKYIKIPERCADDCKQAADINCLVSNIRYLRRLDLTVADREFIERLYRNINPEDKEVVTNMDTMPFYVDMMNHEVFNANLKELNEIYEIY